MADEKHMFNHLSSITGYSDKSVTLRLNRNMKKILWIILMFQTISGFSQEPVKSKCIDSLSLKLKQKNLLIDSLQQVINTIQNRDDSIYNSIYDGTNFIQPKSNETFNYKQILVDYQNFKKEYKDYLNPDTLPQNLPIDNIQNKSIIGFGIKMHPIYKTEKSHLGIDIPSPKGTNVKSTINGKVLTAKKSYGRDGNQVIIQNNKIKIVYSHLDGISVSEGEIVKIGQVIGSAGNSGLSVANHLHYEILLEDIPINPVFILFEKFTKDDLEYIFAKNYVTMD